MDYIKKIEKNNVGLKTTLKEIFNDIDKRLQQIDGETGGDTPVTSKTETVLVLDADDISTAETVFVSGYLTDTEDNPISGATINLSITYENEETTTTTVTTDSDGTFDTGNKNISPLGTGTAEVTATYNGNNEYEASEDTTSFNISYKFEYNDSGYTVNLLECGALKQSSDYAVTTGVRFTITNDENTIFSAETLGFSTRTGAAQYKDSNNNTITYKLYYNNELQSDAQPARPFNNQYEEMRWQFNANNVQETDTFKLEVIIADENNTTLTELAIECNNPNIVESE